MRVLLFTQWFDPEPTFKGIVFAKELMRQGFDVEVLTGFPNYPGGKVYAGYKVRLLQREIIEGVKVTRVPLYPSHDQKKLGRIFNYISFAVSSLVYGVFFAKKADVIYAYHPPLTIGVVAALIRFFRRTPVVYDIQDMWPDTLVATGMFSNVKALKLISKVCNWVYHRVDHLVVLSPGFKKLLVERGVSESKVSVIYNWCAESSLKRDQCSDPSILPAPGAFQILFAGNMGKAQALGAVIDAMEIIAKKTPQVALIFIGGGVEVDQLKSQVEEKNIRNINFLPAVPMAEIGKYLLSADALLVHLKKDPLFSITIPSKTQAYMAMGKPILMAVDGDAADLIRKSGGGVVANSEDVDSIAEAIMLLVSKSKSELAEMGENNRCFYENKLSLIKGVEKFKEIFQRFRS